MNGRSRGSPHHPRSRCLRVEPLEDRLLLSSGPLAPVPAAPLPTEGPSTPALAAAPTAPWSHADSSFAWADIRAALASAPTGDWIRPAGPLAPATGVPLPADSASTPAGAPVLGGYRPDGTWSGPWEDHQAAPFSVRLAGPLDLAGPAVVPDRLLLPVAGPFVSETGASLPAGPLDLAGPAVVPDRLLLPVGGPFAPDIGASLPADRPAFSPVSAVLGVQWPAHDWHGGWYGDQVIHLWMLAERLSGPDTPAPADGPQLNLGFESASPVSAGNVVLSFLEAGGTRGPVSAASVSPAEEFAGRSGLLAALAGTEAAVERLSADARRQGIPAAKDPVRAVASAPAPLGPAAAAALADPANSAAPGGSAKDGDTVEAAHPPGRAVPVGARGKADFPTAGGNNAAPAADAVGAAAAHPAGSLDLLNLPSRAAALLEGGLPFDLPALTQGVDAFFARLGSPAEARDRFPAYARVLPWLAVLSAAAFELARRRQRAAAAADEVLVGPAAFLPPPDEDR